MIAKVSPDFFWQLNKSVAASGAVLVPGKEGDLVIWDNRAVMHSTTPYEPYAQHRRLLWQIIGKDTSASAASAMTAKAKL
eukprot:SAG31_NODE_1703_length_7495_cov_3.115062_7_plen_80_part_00